MFKQANQNKLAARKAYCKEILQMNKTSMSKQWKIINNRSKINQVGKHQIKF